ncbi:MAG: hypothetical protein ACLPYB_11110 [Desulfobaccales bacterium]
MEEIIHFLRIFKEAIVPIATWIDHHNGFITAVATAVIAAFTLALVCANRQLWKVSKEAADAAKDSADALPAVERAYLFVKVILNISDHDPDQPQINIGTMEAPGANKVNIIVTNHGKTPAIIERIAITNNPFFPFQFDIRPPFGTDLIDIFEHERTYETNFLIHGEEEWGEIIANNSPLICEGFVQYTDVWVITHDKIGFCWQYSDFWEKFIPCADSNRNYRIQQKNEN